jgi:hypothetical protein
MTKSAGKSPGEVMVINAVAYQDMIGTGYAGKFCGEALRGSLAGKPCGEALWGSLAGKLCWEPPWGSFVGTLIGFGVSELQAIQGGPNCSANLGGKLIQQRP